MKIEIDTNNITLDELTDVIELLITTKDRRLENEPPRDYDYLRMDVVAALGPVSEWGGRVGDRVYPRDITTAVKAVRQVTGVTLKLAKEYVNETVDQMREEAQK